MRDFQVADAVAEQQRGNNVANTSRRVLNARGNNVAT